MNKYVILTMIILLSCGSNNAVIKKLPETDLKEALEVYQNGEYEEAKNLLYAITIKYAGTKVAEDAQFYLAECYFKTDRFLVAANSYQQIVDRYRRSPYLETSQYKEAKCYYFLSPGYALDQQFTTIAVRKYNNFLKDWPQSEKRELAENERAELEEKLAKKQYENIVTYYKMNKHRAALQTADLFIENHSYSKFIKSVYIMKAKIYLEREEPVKAEQEIQLLFSKFPDFDKENEEYQELLIEIESEKEKKRSKI